MASFDTKRARLPLSYAVGDDTGLARGGKPPLRTPPKPDRVARVIFRCTDAEKVALLAKADLAGVSVSQLMREALGLVEAKRRRAQPRVDPSLIFQIARIGGNLNQIARWLNAAATARQVDQIDALVLAARLVAIERALSLMATTRALASGQAMQVESIEP